MLSVWACVCVLECVWLFGLVQHICATVIDTHSRVCRTCSITSPPAVWFWLCFNLLLWGGCIDSRDDVWVFSPKKKKHIWLKSPLGSNFCTACIHYRSDSNCVCVCAFMRVSVVISTGNPRVISHTAQWQEVRAVMGRYNIHFQLSPYPRTTTADRSTAPRYRHLFISE